MVDSPYQLVNAGFLNHQPYLATQLGIKTPKKTASLHHLETCINWASKKWVISETHRMHVSHVENESFRLGIPNKSTKMSSNFLPLTQWKKLSQMASCGLVSIRNLFLNLKQSSNAVAFCQHQWISGSLIYCMDVWMYTEHPFKKHTFLATKNSSRKGWSQQKSIEWNFHPKKNYVLSIFSCFFVLSTTKLPSLFLETCIYIYI